MSTVLSTKILTPVQKQLILNAGIGFVEYDAIKIEHLKFDWDRKPQISSSQVKTQLNRF